MISSQRRKVTANIAMWGILAIAICCPSGVSASDFATDSNAWNGLAHFVELGEGLGVDIQEVGTLEWSEVSEDDAIFVIYPRQMLDTDSSAAFLVNGGRMLVADDFGGSQPFLERLSLRRETPSDLAMPHRTFVDDHPGWPIFSIRGRHDLLDGVQEVIANYPAVLYNEGGPVIGYEEGGGLVYDMVLGQGRAVVVADPSLLINVMLEAGDNRSFALNLWQYLCRDTSDCRVWLLIDDFDARGSFDGGPSSSDDPLADRIDAANQLIREIFEKLPRSELLYFLSIFLVVGAIAYLMAVFPWRRSRQLSSYIGQRRQGLSRPLTEFDWNLERFVEPGGPINHALPVAVLKESFEEHFLRAFELWPTRSKSRPSVHVLAKRFVERYCANQDRSVRRRRQEAVERLLADLARIPSRNRVFMESDDQFSARDMIRLHRRIIEVLEWMGERENYERRTREINGRIGDQRIQRDPSRRAGVGGDRRGL